MQTTIIEAPKTVLKFYMDDSDNCRKYYKGDNGRLYCTVEDKLHACTEAGEPSYPISNTDKFTY